MTDTPKTQTDIILADQAESLPGQWIGSDINLMHEMWPDLDLLDFRVMLRVCMARGLNPLDKELYPMVYNKGKARGGKNGRTLVLVESIDAMRRRGQSAGIVVDMEGPQFCGPNGEWTDVWPSDDPPFAARFGMQAKGMNRLVWHVRLWSEAAKKGDTDYFWKDHESGGQPVHMLGIAAERQAWRKTCPGVFSSMYGVTQEGARALAPTVAGVEEITWAEDLPALKEGDDPGVIEHETAPLPDEPEWDATEGPTDDEYDIQDVFRALWKRMHAATPSWEWKHLAAIPGWPEGADREQGIRALLVDAIGSEDELADMVFSALEATRS